MRLKFEATKDFKSSQKNIKILLRYALKEDRKGNESNRNLFLKLSLVLLVTRFQVFVESILKEFDYKLKQTGKPLSKMPCFYRLNSFKLVLNQVPIIHKEVENPTNYNRNKILTIQTKIATYQQIIKDDAIIDNQVAFLTKFPMGKNGLNELVDLFKQLEGINIFETASFDSNKINEILRRRHDIIHEDKNQQITEITIEGYYNYLQQVVEHIDDYLKPFLSKRYVPPSV